MRTPDQVLVSGVLQCGAPLSMQLRGGFAARNAAAMGDQRNRGGPAHHRQERAGFP